MVRVNSSEPPSTVSVPTVPASTQAPPTSTPEPTPTVLRERELVWVYADSTIVPQSCFDLLADMIPVAAPASLAGKAVECSPGVADLFRTTYRRNPGGLLQLREVQLFVVTTPALPQPFGDEACRDIAQYLLPASQPVENAGLVAVCSWVPPVRGAPVRPRIETWSAIVKDSTRTEFPAETPCWQMLPYLGAPRGADTVKLRCVID